MRPTAGLGGIRRLAMCAELRQRLRLPLRVRYGSIADDRGQTMDSVVTVVRPHRFTVAEYHRMAEVGILGEDSASNSSGGKSLTWHRSARRTLAW